MKRSPHKAFHQLWSENDCGGMFHAAGARRRYGPTEFVKLGINLGVPAFEISLEEDLKALIAVNK